MRAMTLLVLVCMITMAGNAAAQAVAFQDNFNHDTPGSAPNVDPPGDPDEDSIGLWTVGGPMTVEERVGDITGQPVLLDRQQTGSFTFYATNDPDLWFCDAYTVRWRSAARNNLFFFACAVRSHNYQLLAGVEYRQGLDLSFNGIGNQIPGGFQIDVMQEFEITLDMAAKTTSLSVDGVPVPGLQNISQYQVNGDGMKSLSFEAGGLDNLQFVIDDIEVIAECGGTPVESASWGLVKSIYR